MNGSSVAGVFIEKSGHELALEPMRFWFVEGRGREFQVREIMVKGKEEGIHMSIKIGQTEDSPC